MIYKLQTGGVIKLQNAGSLPKWMQKLNSWSIPDSDESAGERILNSTIEQANDASTQEERDQIYKDSAKKNLAVTGQSLMMIPMLNEFATYGLLGGGLRLGAGIAGSKAGEYVLGKGGDWADKKLNTKFLGTTGRILGGLGGWWGGSSATTPLFRNLAGKGITLHMPQETFMNLRGQYFDRAAKNIKLDTSTLPKLQYRDRLTKDYLEFGPDSNISGDNVSKLVHWDPMTTGTRSALPINGGFNRDPVYFPHFENGKLVPAIGQIRSKLGNGQMYEHPYHPIFFGGNKPWWETPGSNFSDQYLKQTTFNKSKFTGPKQYYDRWAKTERRNLRNLRNWYTKYGPQNKSDRYLITDPENLVDYEFSHKLGIMGSEVPMSKLEGFEYDPLLGTFKRARYTDPSKQTRVIPEGTYPLYTGPKHSIIEVVNPDGTVNPRAALRIEREVADNIPGAYRMEARLENPEWHKSDPTTWAHTKNVAQSAWTIPTPKGLTKQDQMVAALGHDLGKIVSGDGHAKSSAALIEQIFPDITAQQLEAISEHMGTPKSILGKVTKQADILNGKPAITRFVGDNGKIRLRLPSHTVEKPRELVLDPQGNNKFRVHTRTWDGDHIPAEMSVEDKNTLFNALYEELPEGAEILFPESGPGNYATRGTVAGLQRLARDSRFKPTDNGMLQYIDKDGSIKTFEGTGFRKPKSIKPVSRPITEAERLGIPKGERSNPKVLEDPYYWGYQQWNSRYNTAVNSGNLQEAQRLRDLHFKQKAPDTQMTGTYYRSERGEKPWYIFDIDRMGTNGTRMGKGIYFFNDAKAVKNYGNDVREFFINSKNLVEDVPGPKLFGYPNEFINKMKNNKVPSLRKAAEHVDGADTIHGVDVSWGKPLDEWAVKSPNQIKLVDPITRTDMGEIIPIVKRDNFHNFDIRYKQGGIIKGQLGISSLPINPALIRDTIKQGFLKLIPRNIAIGTANALDSDRTVYQHKLPTLDDIKNIPKYGRDIVKNAGDSSNPVYIDPGNAFLLDRNRQKKFMENLGYHLIDNDDYGPVTDAVKTLKSTTSNPHVPIYQIGEDEVDQSEVEPVIEENKQAYYMSGTPFWGWYEHNGNKLWNANNYPVAVYRHKITGDIYQRGFDLNDYGAHKHPLIQQEIELGKYVLNPLNWFKDDFDQRYFDIYDKYEGKTKGNGIDFGRLRALANLYDAIGNPFVQQTRLHKAPKGYQEIYKQPKYQKQGGRFKNPLHK